MERRSLFKHVGLGDFAWQPARRRPGQMVRFSNLYLDLVEARRRLASGNRHGPPPRLGGRVNGAWPVFDGVETRERLFPTAPFTHLAKQHVAYPFTCDAAAICDGWNSVVVLNNTRQPPRRVKVVSLELGTRA